MSSDKIVIAFILAVALAATSFAWWYRREQGRRALEFWGSEAAYLMRHAPHVELLRLAGEGDTGNWTDASTGEWTIQIGQTMVPVGARYDISRAPGVVNARQALIEDASFEWGALTEKQPSDWEWAIVFSTQRETRTPDARQPELPLESVTILFDLTHSQAGQSTRGDAAQITIAAGLSTFFNEQRKRGQDSFSER